MVDRATNRSRGFGFVTFETEEAVEAVMRNKCEMMGKWVEVKRAEPRDSRCGLLPYNTTSRTFNVNPLHFLNFPHAFIGTICVSAA